MPRQPRPALTQFSYTSLVPGPQNIVLNHLDPASTVAFGLLIFALVMVIMFEATNGFHDAANAVATVIYTKSLQPGPAVMLSGVTNFVGVIVGGIAVAYALVELLPAEVLSPPDGGPAVAMLVSLFIAALSWNIGTWWLGLPNSSSHCLIGSLIGIALGNAFVQSRSLAEGLHWAQLWKVLQTFNLVGDGSEQYGIMHPMLDTLSAALLPAVQADVAPLGHSRCYRRSKAPGIDNPQKIAGGKTKRRRAHAAANHAWTARGVRNHGLPSFSVAD